MSNDPKYVDTSIGLGEGSLTALAPEGRTLINGISARQNIATLDAAMYEGNSIDIAGYHITVNEHKVGSALFQLAESLIGCPGLIRHMFATLKRTMICQ